MRELLIAISKMDELQYLFLRHLVFAASNKGKYVFQEPVRIFDSEKETPDYAIRRVGAELFKHPLRFNTHTSAIHLRVLSNHSKDATQPYQLQLAQEIIENKEALCCYFKNGLFDDLRALKRDSSKLIYLKVHGKIEASELEVRALLEDDLNGRFSNIIERKLKPSLLELSQILGLPTRYSTKRTKGEALITIEVNNPNSRFIHYE